MACLYKADAGIFHSSKACYIVACLYNAGAKISPQHSVGYEIVACLLKNIFVFGFSGFVATARTAVQIFDKNFVACLLKVILLHDRFQE